jgi:Transglycosylase-like domain
MSGSAPGGGLDRRRVKLIVDATRRTALVVLLVAVAIPVILPSSGPAAVTPRGTMHTVEAADSLSHDAEAVAAAHSAAVASLADRVVAARNARDALQHRLQALQGFSYRSVTQVLPADTAADLSESRTQHYADVAANAIRTELASAETALTTAEQSEQHAIADYFAALAADAKAQAAQEEAATEVAATQDVAATHVSVASASSGGSCAGAIACFLACTRAHESDTAGGYQAVSPDGVYRGAYQFDQSTWNSVADAVGRNDLVGVNPAAASPSDQDTLATALYQVRGNQPWGGRC